MPSNDSPAFDVLSAEENDLWEWAVEGAGVENAATYIREATLKAARDRQTEGETLTEAEIEREWNKGAPYNANRWEHVGVLHRKGIIAFARHIFALRESRAPEAEREPNELADAQRLLAIVMEQRAELTAELDALKQSRDTDLARARVEGAREALDRVASMSWAQVCAGHMVTAFDVRVLRLKESDYPLPAPKPAECRLSDGSVVRFLAERAMLERSFPGKYAGTCTLSNWPSLLISADTSADFDALKAFAATRTEDTTDGR